MVLAASAAFAATAPVLTSQPETVVLAGSTDSGSFSASADGSPVPAVQWQYATDRDGPWTNISGATSTTLNFTAVPYPNYVFSLGNAFRAVFTNAAGTAISRPAKLVWRTEWMRDLGSDIADVPLNQLTMPGTHDMGTYGITDDSDDSADGQASDIGCAIDHAACFRWATAQDASRNATAELNEGVRYFDLRVCGHSSGILITCHGLNAARLDEILKQTHAWIDSHPYEVVFLDFNHHFELDVESEAAQIEQEFGSLLIPPQYCTEGDPDSGTCANKLTLRRINSSNLGRVIVNFENDDAVNSKELFGKPATGCPAGTTESGNFCFYYRQPLFGLTFYDNHKLFWGRISAQPTSVTGTSGENCTEEAAFTSCFGNYPYADSVLGRIESALQDPPTSFSNKQPFFLQFLQTTPDSNYIENNFGRSLDFMAQQSNPVIGPTLFACQEKVEPYSQTITDCFAQFRPENLNILPINFYNRTDEFDLVGEVIRFNEYARTPPVVLINDSVSPAATGWYNAAVLGGQGKKLQVKVPVTDYRYPTGISSLSCQDNFGPSQTLVSGTTDQSSVMGEMDLGDGYHLVTCTAEDGANRGTHGYGNSGAGPGSTAQPVSFKVDTVPPMITCQNAVFILNQPTTTVGGTVTDATSGPAAASVSATGSTNAVGTFSASLTVSDVAGNSTTSSCSYTVTYGIALRYDPAKAKNAGSTVPIKLSLVDYAGTDVSSKAIPVTAVSVTNTGTGTVFALNANSVFQASPNGYIYTLSTKPYGGGAHTLDFVVAGDPVTHHAPFVIR